MCEDGLIDNKEGERLEPSCIKKRMNKLILAFCLFGLVVSSVIVPSAKAKVVLYEKDGKHFETGGIIQIQYHYKDPNNGSSSDDLFFKRLRPYIAGSLHDNWLGRIQIEFGRSEVTLMDGYIRYMGLKNMNLSLGNHAFPFSREFLTSASAQQLVERTFVGDGNYGSPYRNMGLHLTGNFSQKKFTYGASIASASIDPDNSKLDFDTPVNKPSGSADDWNQGWMIGGRIDWHPLGYLKMAQGDFERKTLATVGIATYSWSNDDDNNVSPGEDVDSVNGYEISGAFRKAGFSVDGEYNLFDAKTIDPTVNTGIYQNGKTDLINWALEGGYMILPNTLEIVAGYQVQDADGYAKKWTRTSLGLNYFIKKHDIKLQGTYRMGENVDGVDGDDLDEFFLQAQFVF